MGGGKNKPANPGVSPYEAASAQIAQDTYNQTNPLRQAIIDNMQSYLNGGYSPRTDPRFAPMYDSAKYGAEKQFGVARDNILASTPAGGGRTAALSGLERGRAEQVGQVGNTITTNLINDLMSKTYGAAFNAPQQSMAGLGATSSSYAARQAAMAQSGGAQKGGFYGMMGGLGQGVGSYMGGK